jgi:beta-lactamase class A
LSRRRSLRIVQRLSINPPKNMTDSTINRRQLLQRSLALPLALNPLQNLAWAQPMPHAEARLQRAFQQIEARCQGRLGVQILHTGTGQQWGWRSDERFLMCSSFKLLLAAQVLAQEAAGQLTLDERLPFAAADLVAWSPITEAHAAQGGMAIGALCAATLATSDNTAANLLLQRLGGTAVFTRFMRTLGDEVTRLDRPEAGEPDWDTSSPRAMALSLQRLMLGDTLPPPQQQRLKRWLQASTTGGRRLKAGLPTGWQIAEKTGTSDRSSNDVGIVWPKAGAALVVASFIADSRAAHPVRDACLAAVAQLLAQTPIGLPA